MAGLSKGRGVERILAKLKVSVENGQYYEAHQMYRTLYFRYSSQKQYPELLELLYSGSLDLLLHKQNEVASCRQGDTRRLLVSIPGRDTEFLETGIGNRIPDTREVLEDTGIREKFRYRGGIVNESLHMGNEATWDKYGRHVETYVNMSSHSSCVNSCRGTRPRYRGTRSHRVARALENGSGADLAMLFVEVLTKANVDVSEEILEKICRLHSLIWADTPERSTLLNTSIQWSRSICREHKVGHPRLHQLVAVTFWKEKNYSQSSFHFLRSMDGEGCASMLVEYHMSSGYSSEVDLFVAQAVFQYLCLRNKVTANLVFFTYAERHPNINHGPPFLMPLLNFLWFLLLTIETGKLTVFTVLCEEYQTAIRRDPAYSEYLDKIGQLFFGLPPPKPRHNNMFGNLLQSILSGIDDDSDEETLGSTSCQQLQTEELD